MFKITIFALCVVSTLAASLDIAIVRQDSDVGVDGKYHYSFEQSDGTKAEQSGELKHVGNEDGEAVVGSFEYKGDDGKAYHVDYTADENGYVPHGDHIPAIPEYIVKALKWAAEHPYKEPENKH